MDNFFPLIKQWNLKWKFMEEIHKLNPFKQKEWIKWVFDNKVNLVVHKHSKNAQEYNRAMGIIINGTWNGFVAEKKFKYYFKTNYFVLRDQELDAKGIDYVLIKKENLAIYYCQVKSTDDKLMNLFMEEKRHSKYHVSLYWYYIYLHPEEKGKWKKRA